MVIFFKAKVRFPALTFLFAVLLVGCALRDQTPTNTLVFGLSSSPPGLDSRLDSDAYTEKVASLLFDGLLARDSREQLIPALAESYTQLSPVSYTFALRKGVRFHDGSLLTARDVAATFHFMLDPANQSFRRKALEKIRAIDTPDDYTVVFQLTSPHAPFLSELTVPIMPAHAQHPDPERPETLVGTGPYRLRRFERDREISLEAFADHYAGAPATPFIRFKIIPDATVRALELMHGSVDIAQNDLPAQLLESLRQREGLKIEAQRSLLVKYLAFNLRDPSLSLLPVRQAIALSLDRDEVIRYRYKGFAEAASSLLTPLSPYFAPDLTPVVPDRARARNLLDAAGYPDPPGPSPRFTLVYKTSLDQTGRAVARVFQAQLREVGIELRIESSEFGVFFDDIKRGEFQLYSLTAVGVRDPDYFSFLCHSRRVPPDGANRVHYLSPQMDALLDAGTQETDFLKRRAIYQQVQVLFAHDLPYFPLWIEQNVAVMQASVQGYEVSPNGDYRALARTHKTAALKR